MAYTPYYPDGWNNSETGATPITAEALNHMDNGIKTADENKVGGANILPADPTAWENAAINSNTGANSTNTSRMRLSVDRWATVTPGQTYTISQDGTGYRIATYGYQEDGTYVPGDFHSFATVYPFTWTAGANTARLRVAVRRDDGDTMSYDELAAIRFKVEAGDKATDWTPTVDEMTNPPHNWAEDGRCLKTVFGTAAALHAAVAAGDFSKIRVGDYWPLEVSGTFYDYGVSEEKTISTTLRMEVAGIETYSGYSGSTAPGHHLLMMSRHVLPVYLKYRSAARTWEDATQTNPWKGSALYRTLNDADNGLISILAESELGDYIYEGSESGMVADMVTKGPEEESATSVSLQERGILFLPKEKEVVGATVGGSSRFERTPGQWPIFQGTSARMVKRLGGPGGNRTSWWMETPADDNADQIMYITNQATVRKYTSSYASMGVPVCFLLV